MTDSSMAQASAPAPLPMPASSRPLRVNWRYALTVGVVHLLALLAAFPSLFSWTGLVLLLVGTHVYGQAINIGYHRLLSHRSFRVPKWLEHAIVWVGLTCLEDTPGRWVATHRYHHTEADEEEDPHSPLVSFLWAHLGWLFIRNARVDDLGFYERYARDILRDPFYMRLERRPLTIFYAYAVHAAAYFAAGFAAGWFTSGGDVAVAAQFGGSLLVWGVFLRTVLVWHITWSVNSLTHLFGYRSYETGENSRNNWLVALLSVGEGWHNNHHEDPASASVQHRWWEVDVSWYEIELLRGLGLAWNVTPPKHRRRRYRSRSGSSAEPDEAVTSGPASR